MTELNEERTGFPAQEHINALLSRIRHLEERLAFLEGRLPRTSLLSSNFLARAFTIFGHQLVAQLIIAVPIWVLILGFTLLVTVLTR